MCLSMKTSCKVTMAGLSKQLHGPALSGRTPGVVLHTSMASKRLTRMGNVSFKTSAQEQQRRLSVAGPVAPASSHAVHQRRQVRCLATAVAERIANEAKEQNNMVQDLEEVFQLHVSQFLTMDRQPLPGASPFTAEPVYLLPAELQQQTADLPRSGARCGVSARGCVTWQSDISYKPQTYWKLPKQAHPNPTEVAFGGTDRHPHPGYTVTLDPLVDDVLDMTTLFSEEAKQEQQHKQRMTQLEAERDAAYASARRLRRELAAKEAAHEQEVALLRAQLAAVKAHNSSKLTLPTAVQQGTSTAAAPKLDAPKQQHTQQLQQAKPRGASVNFAVKCSTQYGQRVLLVGDHPKLGCWTPSDAVELKWSAGGCWTGIINFPADTKTISYKAVLQHASGQYTWCEGGDYNLTLAGVTKVQVEHTVKFAA